MNDNIFTSDEILFTYDMIRDEKIKKLFHKDHVRKCKCLNMKRKSLLAEAFHTVCDIICLINVYAAEDMLWEDIDRTCNDWEATIRREADTTASREGIRLMQLGFLANNALRCVIKLIQSSLSLVQ